MIKGPVVTRHRIDAEEYDLVSRRTGQTVARVSYDFATDRWVWKLAKDAKPVPRSPVKPPREGSEKTLSEAQAAVEYLTRRHDLDRNGR